MLKLTALIYTLGLIQISYSIGEIQYVSYQKSVLFDGTIIDNITFGDNSNKINLERIKKVVVKQKF